MLSLSLLKGIGHELRSLPLTLSLSHKGELTRVCTSDHGLSLSVRPLSHGERDRVRGIPSFWRSSRRSSPSALFGNSVRAESNLVPHPPKGRGEHCVADTDYMRRYHMTMMKHQRDDTVHEGVRGGKFSIGECVGCHAVKGDDGQPVSYESPKHFCRSCHDYAAVSIDCFECHSSKPGAKSPSAAAEPPAGMPSNALASYTQGSHP